MLLSTGRFHYLNSMETSEILNNSRANYFIISFPVFIHLFHIHKLSILMILIFPKVISDYLNKSTSKFKKMSLGKEIEAKIYEFQELSRKEFNYYYFFDSFNLILIYYNDGLLYISLLKMDRTNSFEYSSNLQQD